MEHIICPNCGKEIPKPPLATTVGKQLGIYVLSIFLPPLGLWPGIKYVLQNDKKANIIGFVAIVLTIFSSIITICITVNFVNKLQKTINNQSVQQQNLGF